MNNSSEAKLLYCTIHGFYRVSTRCVLADRKFYAGDVIAAFHEYGLKYVIPARRTARVKRFVARMDGEVTVEQEYALYAPVKHGTTRERVVTKLVGLPADEDYDEPSRSSRTLTSMTRFGSTERKRSA